MKTGIPLPRWFLAAASLCAVSNHLGAASQLTFTNTWKDAGAYDSSAQMYYVKTTGSFSAKVSLPLQGLDLSGADAGTQFSLSINGTQIISDTLGDAAYYSASKKSATFALKDPNSKATIGSVTVSWTATTISVTGSATEDILGEEQMFASDTTGTNSSTTLNSAVTGVYYTVQVGLDASDNGGGTFNYQNANVPVKGNNKETEFNPPDLSGPYPLESGSISGTGDFTPPVLTVTSPAQGLRITSSVVPILSGKASDNVGLAGVWCAVNGDFADALQVYDPTTNLLSTSWNFYPFDITQYGFAASPGTNLLQFYAIDTSSNVSGIVARYVFWAQSTELTLQISGSGTVTGLKNNQNVYYGQGYQVKATPAKGYILESWTDGGGDYLSTSATYNYIVGSGNGGPNLNATFVSNPYPPLKGTYTGLFFDSVNGATPTNAGYLTLTLTTNGAYTGKLYLGTSNYPISGQFNFPLDYAMGDTASNWTEVVVKPSANLELGVSLELNMDGNLTDPGAGFITGTISAFDPGTNNQYWDLPVTMELSQYPPAANMVPGVYNFAIPPVGGDPSQAPGGYGYGTATLTSKGAVSLVMNLADGVSPAISFSSSVASDGTFPFYNILYGGNGVILGWLQFTNDPFNLVDFEGNNVAWAKLPVADKFYTGGFSTFNTPFVSLITGSRYVAPKPGTNLFGWTSGVLSLGATSPNASDLADITLTFNPAKNSFSATGVPAKELTLSFATNTGLVTGSYLQSAPKTTDSFHCLENNGSAWGFYTGANYQTGPVTISSAVGGPAVAPAQAGDDWFSTGAIDTALPPATNTMHDFPAAGN